MKKLKAGSLQLVTFIVVVIALLLASFIVLIHIHKQFRIKTNHIIETISLVDKGIQHALHQKNSNKDTTTLVLDDSDYKSIKIHKGFWGTYEKMYSEASIKHITLKKTALVGSKRNNNEPVLYLKDNNRPLVVVGKTKIKGKAYLPKRGVKSGNIAGESYYGENYIYGTTALSENFPKLNKELLDYFEILNNGDFYNLNEGETLALNASKEHINSFGNSVQLIYSNSDLVLSDVSILGHIIIQSKTKISVDKTAHLKDVILIAPVIEMRDHVKGTFQVFATKRISVAHHVNLEYPSALVLNRDSSTEITNDPSMIYVADHSTIKGNIIALGLSPSTNYEAQIKISSNATVKGIIYCEQNLELRGTVYGTVYTNNFIIKEKGSIYQNHVYNALISSEDLASEFVGVLIEDSKKGVAKWLY
jgi:hypothetical protein